MYNYDLEYPVSISCLENVIKQLYIAILSVCVPYSHMVDLHNNIHYLHYLLQHFHMQNNDIHLIVHFGI